jgi:hypothetical protein
LGEAAVSSTSEQQISPCIPFPCGLNAECVIKKVENTMLNVTSDIALCQCPPKTTGNADIECYPIEEKIQSSEEEESTEEQSSTEDESDIPTVTTTEKTINNSIANANVSNSLNSNSSYQCTPECGINSRCLGKNSCSCPASYQGNPYIKCYPISCSTVDDCDNINASCISGKCVEQGSTLDTGMKQCGINAINIVADGKSTCICPTHFTGIATIACHQISKSY